MFLDIIKEIVQENYLQSELPQESDGSDDPQFVHFRKNSIEFIKSLIDEKLINTVEDLDTFCVNTELVQYFIEKTNLDTSICNYLMRKVKFSIDYRFLIRKQNMELKSCAGFIVFARLVQNVILKAPYDNAYNNFNMIQTLALPIKNYVETVLKSKQTANQYMDKFYDSFQQSSFVKLVRNTGSNFHLKNIIEALFLPLEFKIADHLVIDNLPAIIVRFISEDVNEQAKSDFKDHCISLLFDKLTLFYPLTVVKGILNDATVTNYTSSNATKNSVRIFNSKKNLFLKNITK